MMYLHKWKVEEKKKKKKKKKKIVKLKYLL